MDRFRFASEGSLQKSQRPPRALLERISQKPLRGRVPLPGACCAPAKREGARGTSSLARGARRDSCKLSSLCPQECASDSFAMAVKMRGHCCQKVSNKR